MKTNGTHTYTEACAAQRKQRAARWLKNTTRSGTCSWQRQLYGATWNGYKTKRLILTQMRRIWRNERIHLRLVVPQCVAASMIFSIRFNSFADSEIFFHSSKGFGSTIKSFVLCSENATLASIVRWNHNLLGSELFSVSNIQIRSLLFLWCDGNHNQKSRKYIKWRFKVHTWHDNQPFLNWRKRIVSIIVSFKLQIIRAPLYKWTVLTGCLS